MIKRIYMPLLPSRHEPTDQGDLVTFLNDGYLIIGHATFDVVGQPTECYTLYKAPEKAEKLALDDIYLSTIVSIERGETSNNARPMWRCKTDDGEKVNVFKNDDDEKKDSFHLFEAVGWGDVLMGNTLGFTKEVHIPIAMRKSGIWWEVCKVRTKPQSDMPDWAREPYLFDDIVTEDDGLGGAE